jgi:Aspartyl protease
MNKLLVAVCALVSVAIPAAASADAGGAALQQLHKTFAGFSFGDGRIRSLSYVDTATALKGGTPQRTVSVRRIGLFYRSDVHDLKGNVGWSDGFTGNLFWYSDFNGLTVPVFGDSAKFDASVQLLFSDAIATLPWEAKGTQMVGGQSLSVVRAELPHAYPIELYLDPKTGAYVRGVIDPKGDHETTILVLAYGAAAPGTQIITKWRYDLGDDEHTLSKIAANGDVTNEDLHPPAQTAHWQFSNPAPFPVRLTKHRILVKAKVNGVEGLFVLDSGAQNILISGTFARRAGLHPMGHSELGGPDIDEKVDTGVASTIDFGGNILNDVTVYFGSKNLDEEGPDGLIGFDLFGGALVALDFDNSTMQISDSAGVDPEAIPGIHARVDLADGTPSVPMRLENRVDLYADLDTGNPEEALIPYDLPQREGLHFANEGYNDSGDDCGNLQTLQLGPIKFATPQACLSAAMTGHQALVGYQFFRGFGKVYFDYAAAELIFVAPLKPREAFH